MGRHVREWAFVLVVAVLYTTVRGLASPEQATEALANAELVVHLERSLGLFLEPAIQGLVEDIPGALAGLKLYYLAMHVPPIAAALVFVYVRCPQVWPRYRNALVLFTLVAGAIHVLVPLAPPWFVDGLAIRDPFPGMHPDGMAASGLGNPLAAMPSMHFGWALAAGYAFLRWAENPVLRAAGLLHPLVMGVAIVVTGNHYLLDAVASALLLAAASLVGPRLEVGWIAGDEPEVDPEPASPIVGSLTSTRRPSGRGDR